MLGSCNHAVSMIVGHSEFNWNVTKRIFAAATGRPFIGIFND